MDDINNFIIIFILSTILSISFINLFNNIIKKPQNIYYHVNNLIYNLFYCFIYIFIFILFFYSLRIYNIGQEIEITTIGENIIYFLTIYYSFNVIFQIILLNAILLIIAKFFLLFFSIHKFFMFLSSYSVQFSCHVGIV